MEYYSGMLHLSAQEANSLRELAQEIREQTDDAGYTVEVAVSQNDAFTHSRGPTRVLERSLVVDAARRAAPLVGLEVREESGGLSVVMTSDRAVRNFRVKRVEETAAGNFEAICGLNSRLLVSDPEALIPEEKWVLGYTTSDDHTIEHLIAAEVVDFSGTGPVKLVLGPILHLSGLRPPSGFVSSDEELEGFEDSAISTDDAV